MSSRSSTLLPNSNSWDENSFKIFDPGSPGGDWNLYVHPQGWVYFYNSALRVVTDHDIREPGMIDCIVAYCAKTELPQLPEGLEFHLHLPMQGNDGAVSFNLIINHSLCLASYNLEDVMEERRCSSDPQKLNRCRRLYWNYLWNHPVHASLSVRALEDASDALLWFYTDNLVSGTKSIVPFSKAECDELSRIVRELSLQPYAKSISKTVFVSWFLREVCSFRDAEAWGQHTLKKSKERHDLRERTRRKPPVYNPSRSGLWFLNFTINFLFFGIPHSYRAHVKMYSQYHGRLTNMQQNWEKYIERLVRDYSHFLLLSTVLLSATVGMLSLPNIPESATTTAVISALTSLGSIIIGVFLIWRHQANSSTTDCFTYMHNAQHCVFGLYGHSAMLSLPPALLVWAILSFSVSLILYAVGHRDGATTSGWVILAFFVVLSTIVATALYTFSKIWKLWRRGFGFLDKVGSIWKNSVV